MRAGSSAGILAITVSRVGNVVPWRAYPWPLAAVRHGDGQWQICEMPFGHVAYSARLAGGWDCRRTFSPLTEGNRGRGSGLKAARQGRRSDLETAAIRAGRCKKAHGSCGRIQSDASACGRRASVTSKSRSASSLSYGKDRTIRPWDQTPILCLDCLHLPAERPTCLIRLADPERFERPTLRFVARETAIILVNPGSFRAYAPFNP